jgi:membrane-associated protein
VVELLRELIFHSDVYLGAISQQYGLLIYLILFMMIFCETGLVVTPFLPGDSLIFIAGALAANGLLNEWLLFAIMTSAAILGNIANFALGSYFGPMIRRKLAAREKIRFIKTEHVIRTQEFFAKHGGITIVVTRFMPFLRTFAPFVAGIGQMDRTRFHIYNLLGGTLWVGAFVLGGYFFGNSEFVKENLTLAVLGVVFISSLPPIVAAIMSSRKKNI